MGCEVGDQISSEIIYSGTEKIGLFSLKVDVHESLCFSILVTASVFDMAISVTTPEDLSIHELARFALPKRYCLIEDSISWEGGVVSHRSFFSGEIKGIVKDLGEPALWGFR
jgi:hypothetical protein